MKSYNIKSRFYLAIALAACLLALSAKGQDHLSRYIDEGIKGNITLQQKKISLKQAHQSLQIARSYFLPSVNVLGDYTSGKGGRSIQFPIGDLMNPVYASLNQLTQSDKFPQIENVEQNFFPRDFYDARVRTSLPLINTDLHINQNIQGQRVLLQEYEVDVYKRNLIFEIKNAYYNYLSALSSVKIYESAMTLINKNVDVNESLLRNGKSLPANVLRSKSEAEKIRADLNDARAQVINAQKYFNFLLNKDLYATIEEEQLVSTSFTIDDEASIQGREELQMMKVAQEISTSSLQAHKLSRLPKLGAFVDLGSQASNWQFNSGSRYYLVGVQLTLPIFQGFRNNIQIKHGKLEVDKAALELQNNTARLQVAADLAWNTLQTSRQNHQAAREQLLSAKSYFNLVDKGYQQGVNSLIEFIDARNQLTSSELQLSLRHYDLLKAVAQYERETSSFNLPE
jgi:outer membrane protein